MLHHNNVGSPEHPSVPPLQAQADRLQALQDGRLVHRARGEHVYVLPVRRFPRPLNIFFNEEQWGALEARNAAEDKLYALFTVGDRSLNWAYNAYRERLLKHHDPEA